MNSDMTTAEVLAMQRKSVRRGFIAGSLVTYIVLGFMGAYKKIDQEKKNLR